MFLTVFLFTLVLYSVGAERLKCDELLEPLENQTQACGQWFWIAGASSNKRMARELRRHNWIEINATDNDNKRAVDRYFRGKNNTCVHICGWNKVDKAAFRFDTKPYRSSHKGEYLQTFDDQAIVFVAKTKYYKPKKNALGITIILMAKTDHVSNETLKRFRKQAVCAGFKRSYIHYSQPEDFCYEDDPEDKENVCHGIKEEPDYEESYEEEDGDEDGDGSDEEEDDEDYDGSEEEEGQEDDEEPEEEKEPQKKKS